MDNHAGPDGSHHLHRPDLERRGTTNTTLSVQEEATPKDKEGSIVDVCSLASPDPDPSRSSNSPKRKLHIVSDAILLLSILLMVAWPWALFGVIKSRGGIQMSPGLAESVRTSPQLTTSIVTLLGTFNRIVATFLFGCAIVRYGQERAITEGRPLIVFGLSALLAFRHMSPMWGMGEWWGLFKRGRRLAVIASLFLCLGAFALIPSGTAGLLAPVRFNSDVLSAGRKNIVTSIATNETFPQQPMTGEPVRFLGRLRGVLPMGPDGYRGLNTLGERNSSSFDSSTKLDYSYTLSQQGLEIEVNCLYDTESLIRYCPIEDLSPRIIAASGSCDPGKGLKDVLENVGEYPTLNLNNTLTYWACGSDNPSPAGGSYPTAYSFYLRGRENYARSIGNITCTLSKFRSRDCAVTYTT